MYLQIAVVTDNRNVNKVNNGAAASKQQMFFQLLTMSVLKNIFLKYTKQMAVELLHNALIIAFIYMYIA